MRIKYFLILLVVYCFFSCDSKPQRTAPSVFLSEPQMVDVLTDVQIMESIITYKKNVNQLTAYLRDTGYDTLFAHYGINDSIFKENLKYYNEVEPLVLERIMDSVEARLGKFTD